MELGKCADGYQMAARRIVAEVPYVHRIAQLREPDGTYIAAGRLCKSKTEPEDWSASGTMEIGAYHRGETQILMEQIQDGVNKHHAMFVKENPDGYDDLYFGGAEGVFRSYRQNGAWRTEQLIDVPASDIVVWDLDGDGQEELAVIEGFHGNKAVLFKDLGHGYERMLEYELNFGHVLWGGSFLGRPALITGSRGGEKELILRRFRTTENGRIRVRTLRYHSGQPRSKAVGVLPLPGVRILFAYAKDYKKKKEKKYEKEIGKDYFPHMCGVPDPGFDRMQFFLTGDAVSFG